MMQNTISETDTHSELTVSIPLASTNRSRDTEKQAVESPRHKHSNSQFDAELLERLQNDYWTL